MIAKGCLLVAIVFGCLLSRQIVHASTHDVMGQLCCPCNTVSRHPTGFPDQDELQLNTLKLFRIFLNMFVCV